MAKQIPLGPTAADAAIALRVVTHLSGNGFTPLAYYQTLVFVKKGRGIGIVAVDYGFRACDCHTGLARVVTERLLEANH